MTKEESRQPIKQALPQSPPDASHPYAIVIALTIGNNMELEQVEEMVIVPFPGGVVRIVKEHTPQSDIAAGLKRVTVHLEAFETACAAERAGKLFALSLLWMAASNRVTVGFRKWMGELPFAVHDRTRPSGISVLAEGRAYFKIKPSEIANIASQVYEKGLEVETHVLTSMQFYAAARLEASEGARFITLMTALEALAVQKDYGDEVGELLDDLAKQLECSPVLADECTAPMRNSLASRLKQLRTESVRQAILRVVKTHIKEKESIRFVDDAYGVRSKILHDGMRTPELGRMTQRLEDIIRQIYASMFGLILLREPFPVATVDQ